jgi:hypothetical protein
VVFTKWNLSPAKTMFRFVLLLVLLVATNSRAQYDPLDDYYEVLAQNSFGVASKCATRIAKIVILVPADPPRPAEPYYDTTSIKFAFAYFDNAGRIYYDSCGGKEPTIERYRYDKKGKLLEHIHDYYWIDVDHTGPGRPGHIKRKWRRYRRYTEDTVHPIGKDLYRYRIRTRYSYDRRDSLVKVEAWSSGQIMEILYLTRDRRGRLSRTRYSDLLFYDKKVEYHYDGRGLLRVALDHNPSVGEYERRKYHWDGDTVRMVTYSGFHLDTFRVRYMNQGLVSVTYLAPSDSLRFYKSRWIVKDRAGRVLSTEWYTADTISNVLNVGDWRKRGWLIWSNTFWLDKRGRLEDRVQNDQDRYTMTHYTYRE